MTHTNIPPEELAIFKSLEDIQVVFDVGARADVDYLEIVPDATFHLFEPNPVFFQELVDKARDRNNVYLNNFGLGDEPGRYMYCNVRQAFEKGESPTEGVNQSLEIRTLDDYIEERKITRIDFLKIDAEGYDYKVLLGGKEAIKLARYIQYEHWDNLQQFHDLLEKDFDMKYIGQRNVLCTRR